MFLSQVYVWEGRCSPCCLLSIKWAYDEHLDALALKLHMHVSWDSWVTDWLCVFGCALSPFQPLDTKPWHCHGNANPLSVRALRLHSDCMHHETLSWNPIGELCKVVVLPRAWSGGNIELNRRVHCAASRHIVQDWHLWQPPEMEVPPFELRRFHVEDPSFWRWGTTHLTFMNCPEN